MLDQREDLDLRQKLDIIGAKLDALKEQNADPDRIAMLQVVMDYMLGMVRSRERGASYRLKPHYQSRELFETLVECTKDKNGYFSF